MAAPSITFLWNSSQNDIANGGSDSGDSNWKVFDPLNDKIAFLGNGTNDQDSNESKDIFSIPDSGSEEVPRQFVNDYSEGKWDRIWLAGSDADDGGGGNYRYVFGVYVDGTTSSAPILQAWDSTSLESYDLEILGGGTPANSMLEVISTKDSAPGVEWTGTPMAGDGGLNSVALGSSAITSPTMLYWNQRLVIPSTANAFVVEPVLCLYITYS